ncbi:guard cell S-type anion channel SLAC1-like [Wolffia australiana]
MASSPDGPRFVDIHPLPADDGPAPKPRSRAAARQVSLQPIRPPRPTAADFSMFRTKSSLSKPPTPSSLPLRAEPAPSPPPQAVVVPAGRYFAALRGPELDHLRAHEDILLPKDSTWPFLLRFPVNTFGVCLGLGSQAILWGSLSSSPATAFLHVSPIVNFSIWVLALASLATISAVYALKCAFFFEAVRREYFHPVRVNFFFAPWIVCMFLTIGAPGAVSTAPHPVLWCAFMGPVLFLELKIYGQWLSGGKRRLCKVANPSSHLSVVGNFVGAILAVRVGWAEPAKFLWAVGFAHYLVVFVTLYQRLPTSEALPKELHPVYSMFIAAPSAASIAWANIYGSFDEVSRTCYFIALFLYISLVVRINFFRGFRFSVAWWSYTFPMTTASLATIKYAEAVQSPVTKAMALALSLLSSAMVFLLFVSTLLHAFFWRTLFPNDLAIAITQNKVVSGRKKGAIDSKNWPSQPQDQPSPVPLASAKI